MAPSSRLQGTGLISEANSLILIVSVGGKPLLCLVEVRLCVLYGHPSWEVNRINVYLRLSVGILLDATMFWPRMKSGAAGGPG